MLPELLGELVSDRTVRTQFCSGVIPNKDLARTLDWNFDSAQIQQLQLQLQLQMQSGVGCAEVWDYSDECLPSRGKWRFPLLVLLQSARC